MFFSLYFSIQSYMYSLSQTDFEIQKLKIIQYYMLFKCFFMFFKTLNRLIFFAEYHETIIEMHAVNVICTILCRLLKNQTCIVFLAHFFIIFQRKKKNIVFKQESINIRYLNKVFQKYYQQIPFLQIDTVFSKAIHYFLFLFLLLIKTAFKIRFWQKTFIVRKEEYHTKTPSFKQGKTLKHFD